MKVLLTGGGTGGHIYPALAVARRLKVIQTDVELLYIGTERGLESTIVPNNGIPFKAVEMEGFKRGFDFNSLKYNLNSVRLFLKGIRSAQRIVDEFKPDVVLGTGGYVSAPICYAAAKAGIPTVVHEQNSFLGLTNKFLIRYVDKLAISFNDIYDQVDKHQEKLVFTGNPRGQEVVSTEPPNIDTVFGLDVTQPIILIMGGSRGAAKINQSVVEAYPQLYKNDYQVIFIPGAVHFDEMVEQLNRISPLAENTKFVVKPYIDNMIEVLHHVSVVVSRSGATTIAELTALGLPSILIPSPYVTDDHQTRNAMSLVNQEAALLLTEEALSGETLLEKIDELMTDSNKRSHMSQRAQEVGQPHATDQLIQVMLDEIKESN
jgi:UDP-N-acetylglucosamine--N-acetylmuramyl-(pentapeptide) pyrophosphoryl-undecaprenol N-acetylglucosamine transferase